MTEQKVSARYAKALYGLAGEIDSVAQVYDDLKRIESIIASSSELRNLIHSPVINHRKKSAIFEEIFTGKIGKTTLEFIKLLAHKQREALILSISKQYEILYNKMHNIVEATITTAREIDDSTKKQIIAALTKRTGKKINPYFTVNPQIKGGIIVRIEDEVFDASIHNKLEKLRVRLKESVEIEIN